MTSGENGQRICVKRGTIARAESPVELAKHMACDAPSNPVTELT